MLSALLAADLIRNCGFLAVGLGREGQTAERARAPTTGGLAGLLEMLKFKT